jgi:hypothetical protein
MSCSSCCNAAPPVSRPRPPAAWATALRAALQWALLCSALGGAAAALAMPGRPGSPDKILAAGWQADLGADRTLGEGDLRRWGMRIYHARLVGAHVPVDGSEPFALELTYYRSISRERIVDASIEEMQRLAGNAATPSLVASWRATLERCFVDVREGDQLTGVYQPGHGVRFYRGNDMLADIADDAFARAFFAIWLDPRSRDPGLRARLLGERG